MEKRSRQIIERDLPSVGTRLLGKFFGKTYSAKVVSDKTTRSGKAIEYNGVKYKSMTASAKAITKQPTNGWKFWRFQGDK